MNTQSWALVVATYKRHEMLLACVQRALSQTRPPSQIVIVDASPDHEEGCALIAPHCENRGIPLLYVQAEVPSAAAQRNQGIALATAEVLFMIDDDSLLCPDAAEKVMRVYEADVHEQIAGVLMEQTESEPGHHDGAMALEHSAGGFLKRKRIGPRRLVTKTRLGKLLSREVLLMSRERLFIPYTGDFPNLPVPQAVLDLGARRVRLFTGCAMTYRRRVIGRVGFDAQLRGYCPAEDLDASYRASQLGALVFLPGAKLRHVEAAAGRVKRRVATCLSVVNLALFIREHAQDGRARAREFALLVLRRLLGSC